MAVREYIGARYVPLFSDPIEWDETLAYEPLTVVINQGNSYVSKQFVPAGTPLPTTAERSNAYWLLWADFNAQIEQYRAEVATYSGRINANAEAIQGLDEDLAAEILARTNADTSIRNDFAADLAAEATRINEALAAAVDELEQTDEGLATRVTAIENKTASFDMSRLVGLEIKPRPISRFILGSTLYGTEAPFFGRGVAQGGCLFERSNKIYWIQATSNSDYVIVDIETNRPIKTGTWNIGHGNGLSWDGDRIVVGVDETNRILRYLDISQPTTPTSLPDVPFPAEVVNSVCACFIGNTGKIAIAEGALGGWADVPSGVHVYSNRNCTEYEGFTAFNFDFSQYEGYQSISCDGQYYYVAKSTPENIVVFNMSGEFIGIIEIPRLANVCLISEVEDAFMFKGNLYIVDGSILGRSAPVNKDKLATSAGTSAIIGVRAATLLEVNLANHSISPFIGGNVPNMGFPLQTSASYQYGIIDFKALETDWNTVGSDVYAMRILGINPKKAWAVYYFVDDFINLVNSMNIRGGITLGFASDYPFEIRLNEERIVRISPNSAAQGTIHLYGLRGASSIAIDNSDANRPFLFHAIDDSGSGTGAKYPIIMQGGQLVSGGNVTFDRSEGQTFDVQLRAAIGAIPNTVTSRVQLVSNGKNLG